MDDRLFRMMGRAPAATGATPHMGHARVVPSVQTHVSMRSAGRVTTVFFGRQAVRVTDRELLIDDHLYAMSGIDDVRIDVRRVHSLGLLVLAVVAPLPMAGAGLAVSGWSPLTVVIALAGVALSAMTARIVLKMRPETHELWISYEGHPERVLQTDEDWRAKQLASVVRAAAKV
jgi:hypothetical protein